MRTIDKIGDYEFIGLTLNLMGESDKSRISIIGWQDGDYFEELCNENGGIDKFSLDLFKNKPTSEKIDSKETLKKKIIEFQRTPFLISNNGNYCYDWDMYIWFDRSLIIYNARLKKAEIHTQNKIESLFGMGYLPSWLN